jgi:hypothetical protein
MPEIGTSGSSMASRRRRLSRGSPSGREVPRAAAPRCRDVGPPDRDYMTGDILGTDPDPRVRYELRCDGSSS